MRHNDTLGGTSMNPIARFIKRRRPGVLRESCGRAVSASNSQARRGSALLLVIGALALISVFAAIYVTIGQSDQRSSSAHELNRRVQNFGPLFGDYIAQIIAEDRLDTVLRLAFDEGGGPAGGTFGGGGGGASTAQVRQKIYRENTDLPLTDWTVRSIPSRINPAMLGSIANQSRLAFTPGGTQPAPWFVNGTDTAQRLAAYRLDRRVASDPWLASTAPTYLGAGPDRFSATFGAAAERHRLRYLDDRDWAHISNLSPDGFFVNLYNLRGNAGGFNADPAYTIGGYNYAGSPADPPRMSDGLTLLKKRMGDGALQAMDVRTEGFWVPGALNPVAWDIANLGDPENVPALWSTNQRFMLMPMDQAFFSYDKFGVIADWESPDYPAYQYADTDGDGLADARWFELTDSSDSGLNDNQLSYRFLAPAEGYRLFAAARVVDLSALLNINVATDGMVGPTDKAMWTPSSVDLRRALTMQDFAREYRDWKRPASKGLAPGSIKRDGPPVQQLGDGDAFADYTKYQFNPDWMDPTTPPDGAGFGWNGALIGAYSADAVALAIETETSLGASDVGRFGGGGGGVVGLRELSRFDFGDNMQNLSALRQLSYYDRVGSIDPTDPVARGASDLGTGLFGMSDLGEMLTFWGINDDEVVSRLERVLFGRYDDANANITQTTSRFSPYLDGRPTELDRRRHDTLNSSFNPSRPPETDGRVDPDSMALIALSRRRALTTISGGAGILSSLLDPAELDTLNASEAPELIHDFVNGLLAGIPTSDRTSGRDVFEMFSDVLASNAQIRDAWDRSKPEFNTMFYGHQGPELALTLSAFLTANLIDAYDTDREPTPISVYALDPASSLVTVQEFDASNAQGGAFPWIQSQKIKLSQLGDGLNAPTMFENNVVRPAYTVYGLEAYPVLTEVAAMVVMTDASSRASGIAQGDNDASGGGRPWVDPGGSPPPSEITINVNDWDVTNAWNMNPDLALVAFAFQLTNPFDVPISLGSISKGDREPLAADEYLYYVEFNGRMFKVCDFDENSSSNQYRNVVLDPGEARTFYVLANDGPNAMGDIASKWQALRQGYNPGATVTEVGIQAWLNTQFKVSTGGGPTSLTGSARVRRFDPITGMAASFTSYDNVLKKAAAPALGRPATNRVTRLWRRMPVRSAGGTVSAVKTPEHDLLVDRLREAGAPTGPTSVLSTLVPVPSTLTRDEVKNTVAGNEASAGGSIAGRNDNSGFTYVFYGSIRRGDHPGGTGNGYQPAGENGRGVLPAWMIEAGAKTNIDESVPFTGTTGATRRLRRSNFVFSRNFAYKSFADFMGIGVTTGFGPAIETIARHPRTKSSLTGFTSKIIDTTTGGDSYYKASTGANTVTLNPELHARNRAIKTSVTDPYTGVNREVSLVSVSDLLLIPAVGWIEEPDASNARAFNDDQWVTLGESLGYALNMVPAATNTALPGVDPLERLVTTNASGRRYVLDRLHLRLDDYVSFYDSPTPADGVYQANPGDLDVVVGSGLPMAMDLVSRFRRFGPDDAAESLTSKVMGRINLNTATLSTLWSVPMLTPSLETLTMGRREFWGFDPQSSGAATSDIGLWDLDAPERTPDIAAHLLSYRDRSPAQYRGNSFDYSSVNIALAGPQAFEYALLDETGNVWTDPQRASVMVTNLHGSNPANPLVNPELGRTVMTGIGGLREQLGFSTPAEVMAAIVDKDLDLTTLFPSVTFDSIRQNLPTSLGSDVDASGDARNVERRAAGGDSVTTDRLLYLGGRTDQVANDYEEQLAVLNAVLGTTDVRSDTFAVWFVVHGYQESDVADLRPDDPLVPSFARRFIMVVDRSNVTERGQKPRVLLLREVPL